MTFEYKSSQSFMGGIGNSINDYMLEAIDAAMPLLVQATKNAIQIAHPDRSTGALVASVTANPAKKVNGGVYAAIAFPGYGNTKTANAVKAVSKEFGNSRQPAMPFRERAIAACQTAAVEVIQSVINSKIESAT